MKGVKGEGKLKLLNPLISSNSFIASFSIYKENTFNKTVLLDQHRPW